MGVYNPKKKMPTSCYMCWDSLYCEYKIKNPVKMTQGRAGDCPFIEIDLVRCGECKYSKEWYGDHRLCYLWSDTGVGVFEDGFCSYGEKRKK